MSRLNQKRLAAYIPIDLFIQLQKVAIKRNVTITALIIESFKARIAWEKKYD